MFDETNQTDGREESFGEELFVDEEEPAEDDAQNEGGDEEGTLKIKYNGEEREISISEARILAQKGMNYDHVVAERDTKFSRELAALDKIAEKNGLTRREYVEQIENDGTEHSPDDPVSSARERVEKIYESVGRKGPWTKLFDKYPNLSEERADALLAEDVKNGMTPLEAYQSRIIAENERIRKIEENNTASRMRAVGSALGDGAGEVRDAFLEGFSVEE